ncbi:hypothetical protein BJI61_13265 [Acinetobacter baumannii]|nr:hypothetical protein BJI61_13265 [Acinetobacter baumannii]
MKLLSFVTILIIMFTLLMEIHLYLIYFFYYIEHIKSSRNDYKECKNAYYPTNKCSEDLIDEWHKYVHMIEG